MKIKSLFIIAVCVLFAFAFTVHINADDGDEFTDEMYENQLENSGAQQLFDDLPTETKQQMQEMNLGSLSPNALLALTPADFFKVIFSEIKNFAKSPFKLLCNLVAVILLTALIKGLKDSGSENTLPDVFSVIACLSVAALLISPVMRCIQVSLQAVENSGNFMVGFIPVLSGLICASGRAASGGVYYAVLFGAAQIASGLFKSVVVPLICVYLGLSMTSCVSQNSNIEGAAKQIKK